MEKQKKIYALGFFDGVHLGHQALLTACRHSAAENGCRAGVVTFSAHPDGLVLGRVPGLINTIEERKRILLGFGISQVKILPFDEKLRSMPWRTFLENLIADGAAGFVCGDDFRFGFRGEGTAQHLAAFCKERDLSWAVVPAQKLDGTVVSSTYIRQLLEQGNMAQAVRFLGHPHVLTGQVIPGKGLGHTLGFPTANLTLPDGVICPKHGVYVCKAIVDCREYLAVTNIGTRPTVGGKGVAVEAWLLDFAGDLYEKPLTLLFYDFIRPEQKFPTLDTLKEEILKSAEKARKFFENR